MLGIEQERNEPRHCDRAVTLAIPVAIADTQPDTQPDAFGLLGQCFGVAGCHRLGTGWALSIRDRDRIELRVDRADRRGLGGRLTRIWKR